MYTERIRYCCYAHLCPEKLRNRNSENLAGFLLTIVEKNNCISLNNDNELRSSNISITEDVQYRKQVYYI